ncbi:MAG: glutathione S-transferase N-terminal domain-containing protein [Solirubrobacteraceae bacterium]
MPDKPTLHVCSIDDGGPKVHPCRRAAAALTAAGVDHERSVFGPNKPFGLFTSGKRPELKAMSGQEKLPVLELPDGSTINGAGAIVAWAKSRADVTA